MRDCKAVSWLNWNNMLVTPLVLGLKSSRLDNEEVNLIKKINPFGVILFSRNIIDKKQLKNYISDIKKKINPNIHIFIDQEGGDVQRLRTPDWKNYPSFKKIGEIYSLSNHNASMLSYCVGRLISEELMELGIDINCSPCIDIRKSYTNNFLVNRTFSKNPNIVITLAKEMIRGFKDSGIIPILKHIPGHGRATIDSHKGLPEVSSELQELLQDDFITFRELRNVPMAMTAHIKYTKIDNLPATFSKKIIQIIRENIEFEGVIISDDINMEALNGSLERKIIDSLDAGCDIVLHCSGNNLEIPNFIEKIPKIDRSLIDKSLDKSKLFQKDEDSMTIDDVINNYYSILDEYNIIL